MPPMPGDFDLYLLAQTWAPQFCCAHPEKCTTAAFAFSARRLSLHGLWPGYSVARGGETFPAHCQSKVKLLTSQLPREYIDLAPAFTRWNMEKHHAEVGPLARHEWIKHGTCSGLSAEGYFAEALRAMLTLPGDRGTPRAIADHVGGEVPTSVVRNEYGKRVALRTDKQCGLSEVTSCWRKQADGTVGQQVDCPEHVIRGRDTKCASLRINQFGQCLRGQQKSK
eukprot:CAMPEP_0119363654 /NCGR_PEP_ID=MMETSP1334-20130426/10570_1 /TAXON_ID=127549 /ORGANISM="Calcidiscus leptoporus, Strain RCC1130" /LENGTH=223 /DNA_ID=CAMNT_0007379159 /DNA_START=114 /DNA_END=785 /DNA_ORIENTATION=-